MRKKINKIIILLLILDIVVISLAFVMTHQRKQKIKLSGENIVSEIDVEYEVQGNPLPKVTVDDISNTNANINSVVGGLGQSFEFGGNFFNFQLKEANVSMKYDKEKLGDMEEENLLVVWYDEKNNTVVPMKTNVDTEKGIVSFETDHFSQYALVRKDEWEAAWNKRVLKVREDANIFEIAFVIDDSGSMGENDPQNLRLSATQNFVDKLRQKDSYSIIKFEDSGNVIQELTSDKDKSKEALEQFGSGGGTNITAGLTTALEVLGTQNNNSRVIVLLTDGEDSSLSKNKKNIINKCLASGISVFSIYLNDGRSEVGSDTVDIRDIALQTGGEFYSISSDEVVEIFDRINDVSLGIDENLDTDGDGIPDAIEIGGMRNQYGEIIYTNPYAADTDGDGKSDKDEIGEQNTYSNGAAYYKMKTNPNSSNKEFVNNFQYGPRNSYLATWDSGFRLNKNAFQFHNCRVRSNIGVCSGISYIAERTFNQDRIKLKVDDPDVGDDNIDLDKVVSSEDLHKFVEEKSNDAYYTVRKTEEITKDNLKKQLSKDKNSYVLETAEEVIETLGDESDTVESVNELMKTYTFVLYNKFFGFNIDNDTIKNGLLYFYNPQGKTLKNAINGGQNLNYKELEEGKDKDIANALFYYWAYKNIEDREIRKKYQIDLSRPFTPQKLDELKAVFGSKKIVYVGLQSHVVNGYALEQISESEYRLYLYDSNYPYSSGKDTYLRIVQAKDTQGDVYYKVGEDDIYNVGEDNDWLSEQEEKDENGNTVKNKYFRLEIFKGDEILNYEKINE